MQALAAAGLHERPKLQFFELHADQLGGFLDGRPAHALAGVEVESHAVGLADEAFEP